MITAKIQREMGRNEWVTNRKGGRLPYHDGCRSAGGGNGSITIQEDCTRLTSCGTMACLNTPIRPIGLGYSYSAARSSTSGKVNLRHKVTMTTTRRLIYDDDK